MENVLKSQDVKQNAQHALARLAGHPATEEPLQRLTAVTMDESVIRNKSPLIEAERLRAVSDLLQDSHFSPVGHNKGAYTLHLSLRGQHLMMEIGESEIRNNVVTLSLPLAPLRPIIRDYFMMAEAFYKAAKSARMGRLQTIDMARRGLHDEGAKVLKEHLREKIVLDKGTARRLFTLICVLHVRSIGLPS